MSQFSILKAAVQARYAAIKHLPLFASNATKDELWDTYLSNLTESGHNEIYRERGEHDCQCCKAFIRRIGNVVVLQDGHLKSIWSDLHTGIPHYDSLAQAMDALVSQSGIRGIFLHDDSTCGTDSNVELIDGHAHTWEHFYLVLDKAHYETNGLQRNRLVGAASDNYYSLKLSMEQLSIDSVNTVIDLVGDGSLYRGEEHLSTLRLMRTLLTEYKDQSNQDHWLWLKSRELGARSTIRNTVIGSLVLDLSNGKDVETSVKSFESKVAPANYKRTTALVTPAMIKNAEQKVIDLGIAESLPRRPAVITDITVNNVLFADRTAVQQMGGVFGQLLSETKDNVDVSKATPISISDFIASVLPKVTTLDAYLSNGIASSNAMTLVAPVNPQAPSILKWNNNFSWAYNGDVTDSIKERVKTAGGNVTGALRISLAWFNPDDLDIHLQCPKNGHVYFGNKCGILDVDMNAFGKSDDYNPVENLTYSTKASIPTGNFVVKVNNYNKRSSERPGFIVEVEYEGVVTQYVYEGVMRTGATITALEFSYDPKKGLTVTKGLPSTSTSKDVWGLATHKFHRVSSVMLSPNHWDNQSIGNKHFFFMLQGFSNPEPVRGFYTEFLAQELNEHRKVFELLGSKMKVEASADQLSGLGFSSTLRNNLVVRVDGGRLYSIQF